MKGLNLAERISNYGKGRLALDALSVASGVVLGLTGRYGLSIGDDVGSAMILLPAIWRGYYEGHRLYVASMNTGEVSGIDCVFRVGGGFLVSCLETIVVGTSLTKYP